MNMEGDHSSRLHTSFRGHPFVLPGFLLKPYNSAHRHYEALRACFVDGLHNKEVDKRFGYTERSFRVLIFELKAREYRAQADVVV